VSKQAIVSRLHVHRSHLKETSSRILKSTESNLKELRGVLDQLRVPMAPVRKGGVGSGQWAVDEGHG
jgi:hypothetical protein